MNPENSDQKFEHSKNRVEGERGISGRFYDLGEMPLSDWENTLSARVLYDGFHLASSAKEYRLVEDSPSEKSLVETGRLNDPYKTREVCDIAEHLQTNTPERTVDTSAVIADPLFEQGNLIRWQTLLYNGEVYLFYMQTIANGDDFNGIVVRLGSVV